MAWGVVGCQMWFISKVTLGIECKAGKNKATPLQLQELALLDEQRALLLLSIENVGVLAEYLKNMQTLTIDFETYYTKEYGLNKFTTEEYIRDPRFEVIGVAVKVCGNDDSSQAATPVWFSGSKKQIAKFLAQFDWDNSIAIAHNAMFDMAILNWHFGIKPAKIVDTLGMSHIIL